MSIRWFILVLGMNKAQSRELSCHLLEWVKRWCIHVQNISRYPLEVAVINMFGVDHTFRISCHPGNKYQDTYLSSIGYLTLRYRLLSRMNHLSQQISRSSLKEWMNVWMNEQMNEAVPKITHKIEFHHMYCVFCVFLYHSYLIVVPANSRNDI